MLLIFNGLEQQYTVFNIKYQDWALKGAKREWEMKNRFRVGSGKYKIGTENRKQGIGKEKKQRLGAFI